MSQFKLTVDSHELMPEEVVLRFDTKGECMAFLRLLTEFKNINASKEMVHFFIRRYADENKKKFNTEVLSGLESKLA